MQAHLCALIFIFAGAYALAGDSCESNSDCNDGECCQILNPFPIASKRAYDDYNNTCQPYILQGQYCDGNEEYNGYCGCAPGLYCHIYERPVTGKRGVPWTPGYEWVFECDKKP